MHYVELNYLIAEYYLQVDVWNQVQIVLIKAQRSVLKQTGINHKIVIGMKINVVIKRVIMHQ